MIIDQKPQTSFIPKKPIFSGASMEQTSVNFFSLIGLAIFLVALLLAGGVYAYQYYLNSQLTTLQASLDTARKQFDPGFIATATRLNSRIIGAEALLNAHIAPSFIFSDLLEKYTLADEVQYTSFSWNYDSAGNGVITMDGVAKDYTAVALQAQEFASNIQYLKNQIFSNIGLDQNGDVTFSFSASVDASVIDFKDKRAEDLSSANTSSSDAGAQVGTTTPFAPPVPSNSGSTASAAASAQSASPFPTGN